jgi:type III secretion protein N (ATPase)
VKRGRVIDGEVHDARELAEALLTEARGQADEVRAVARTDASRILDDARRLAEQILAEARDTRANISAEISAERLALLDRLGSADRGAGLGAAGDGKVREVVGLLVRAEVPGVELGEQVTIGRSRGGPLPAEVVGFRGELALLMPLGPLAGVAVDAPVLRTGAAATFACGDDLLGRVIDGLGQPLDDGPPLRGEAWPVTRPAPPALGRPRIASPLTTGVRAIDGLLTLGAGQRIGLFAGAGVGKSTLLGQIAAGTGADVCVMCLVGERGRELGELLGGHLAERRERTVAVCAAADAPALVRVRAVEVATAVAEWFRDRRGARVLLLVDSLTRVARAQREVGLACGEPPARHGYPPSVFALLPRLVERVGPSEAGAITAVYTVLVAGGDLDEPIADEVRGLLDGHIVLERRLAAAGHFPPIDVPASVSRVMPQIATPGHLRDAAEVRRRLAVYDDHRDLITLGAYKAGSDRAVDLAIQSRPAIDRFLDQAPTECAEWDGTLARLSELAAVRSRGDAG